MKTPIIDPFHKQMQFFHKVHLFDADISTASCSFIRGADFSARVPVSETTSRMVVDSQMYSNLHHHRIRRKNHEGTQRRRSVVGHRRHRPARHLDIVAGRPSPGGPMTRSRYSASSADLRTKRQNTRLPAVFADEEHIDVDVIERVYRDGCYA